MSIFCDQPTENYSFLGPLCFDIVIFPTHDAHAEFLKAKPPKPLKNVFLLTDGRRAGG